MPKIKNSMPEILQANVEIPELIKDFLKKYRKNSQSYVSSNIPTSCLLSGTKKNNLSELTKIQDDQIVYVYWDDGKQLRKDSFGNIIEYLNNREPWEDYDFCIFPKSLAWCVGVTHNDYFVYTENNNKNKV